MSKIKMQVSDVIFALVLGACIITPIFAKQCLPMTWTIVVSCASLLIAISVFGMRYIEMRKHDNMEKKRAILEALERLNDPQIQSAVYAVNAFAQKRITELSSRGLSEVATRTKANNPKMVITPSEPYCVLVQGVQSSYLLIKSAYQSIYNAHLASLLSKDDVAKLCQHSSFQTLYTAVEIADAIDSNGKYDYRLYHTLREIV